jgi:uncharacterized protein YegL
MDIRLSIMSNQNRKISSDQIQAVVREIFTVLIERSGFADPEGANRVRKCDTCEYNDCHENAKCVSMRERFNCMCKAGYLDDSAQHGKEPGRSCIGGHELEKQDRSMPNDLNNKMCTQTKADVYLLVDMSKTVTEQDIAIIFKMIRQMARIFTYDSTHVKFGLGTFAATFGEVFNFAEYETGRELLGANESVDLIDRGKGTRTGKAIHEMINYIQRPQSGRRSNVPLHIVVVTDGNPFDSIEEPGRRLKQMAQNIQVFAIGKSINPAKLLGMVHTEESIILVDSYEDLNVDRSDQDYNINENEYHAKLLNNICPSDTCPGYAEQDIILVVENSAYTSTFLDQIRNAMKKFVNNLPFEKNVDNNKIRISVLAYSDDSEVIFDFGEIQGTKFFRNQIEIKLQNSGGRGRNLLSAFNFIKQIKLEGRLRKKETSAFFDIISGQKDPYETAVRYNTKVIVIGEEIIQTDQIKLAAAALELKQQMNIDIAIIEISESRSPFWSTIAGSPEYLRHVPKILTNDGRLSEDIHNAFSQLKHNFFVGGCDDGLKPPSWIEVIDNQENELTVAWEPLVGISNYLINVQDEANNLVTSQEVSGQVQRSKISNLLPGKEYNISVASFHKSKDRELKSDDIGTVGWTRPVQATLYLISSSEYSAILGIEVPQNDGDITDVRIYVDQKSTNQEDKNTKTILSLVQSPQDLFLNGNAISLDGLMSNTTYEVKVETSSGPAVSKERILEFNTRSLEPPQNIRILDASTKGVTIQWDADPTIAEVIIKVFPINDDGEDGEEIYHEEVSGDQMSGSLNIYTIQESVDPGTDYRLEMVAMNNVGVASLPSERVIFTTVPESIFQISQDSQSEDRIRFSFSPPKDGGADFFRIELYNRDGSSMIDTMDVDFRVGERQYVKTFQSARLKPGSEYLIRGFAISCPGHCAAEGGMGGDFQSEPVEIKAHTGNTRSLISYR